ncbi:hypothetical protein [Desulfogranum japonicum]|uniref:hypothetical protein n=1 Tax=Desulfogranum japonicum TaxID=231447 RepID=UPI00041873F6|nr:hypothetical protein [Desulfogranum japonicum]
MIFCAHLQMSFSGPFKSVVQGNLFQWLVVLHVALVVMASGGQAKERVLTVYFAGTGMTWNDYIPLSCPWNSPELLASLYTHHDRSKAIEHDSFQPQNGSWPPLSVEHTDVTHFKYFINGPGTSNDTLMKGSESRLSNLVSLLGSIEPDLGTRTWSTIDAEAMGGLDMVISAFPGDDITLNMLGFSRGGVSAMRMAHLAAMYPSVKHINILCFDPVPGGLDPVAKHGPYFVLPQKVQQYVGLYAEDERTYQFEPVIPKCLNNSTTLLLLRMPGSHETMMGNLQMLGHSAGLNLSSVLKEVPEYRVVSQLAFVIVQRLVNSKPWGNVSLADGGSVFVTTSVDTREKFALLSKDALNVLDSPAPFPWSNYQDAIRQTSFLGTLFGGRDVIYTLLEKGHELRVATPLSGDKRFVFWGDERRPFGEWVRGYGYPGGFVFNSEVVYWLNDLTSRINGTTWDMLERFRGDE